jgi:hypothetical protein
MVMDEIRSILAAGDSFAVIEQIQRAGTPTEIAATYQSLLSKLYWKAHDLPAVVAVGRAGILYCLGQSLVEGASPESIDQFRSIAKGLAYDVGSFTWPGWEEPGINPTSADLSFGMECARLNLRLAIELKKPPDRLSMAHWLVGAHALAARDSELALQQFRLAVGVLPGDSGMTTLNAGYLAIARLCKNCDDLSARQSLEEILNHLHADSSEDARTFRSQIVSAQRLFV